MKTLFSSEEYAAAKSTTLLPCECEHCKCSFLAQKKLIKQELDHNRGRVKFCSTICATNHNCTRTKTTCGTCGKEIVKSRREINSTKHGLVYCSKKCSAVSTNRLSPRKKRKVRAKVQKPVVPKFCKFCEVELRTDNTYSRTGHKANMCKGCHIRYQHERMKEKKREMVEFFGGKCLDCGLPYPPEVFDIHHLDPSTKKYNWRQLQKQTAEEIKKELSKCVLLCANCHRIRHLHMRTLDH